MEYYFENKLKIFRIKGRIHEKIILYYRNFRNHIKTRHPEITIEKIKNILEQPDYVYKSSRNSWNHYYEKDFGSETYRVVIQKSKNKKHVKEVVTAYKLDHKDKFTIKHVYCVYDKETFIDDNELQEELENDKDYFYEIFGIAE
ncbi:MAG: hypothetical protein N4A62_14470 [Marinisporobacter sp.]|nr:hypothetical protein [Marinisporobacter sp.]